MGRRRRFAAISGLLALLLSTVFGQNEWRPVTNSTGLFFKTEHPVGNQATCVVRLREDNKLRRTISDLSISYSFQLAKRSQNYSARFEARDSATVYLDGCEQITSIVATKIQRW